jgi:hypothetical protein
MFAYGTSIEHYASDSIRIFRLNTKLAGRKSYKLPMNFLDVIADSKKQFTITTNYNKANLIMLDTLNNVENVMAKFVYPPSVNYIFAMKGIDNLASKASFANMLRGTSIIPRSYDMRDKSNIQRLMQDFNKSYFLKRDTQQQTGLLIIDSVSELINAIKHDRGYVVCQELLKDPMLVARRKINIRIYLLIVIRKGGECEFYMYNDGVVYYSPKEWDSNSLDRDVHITTGILKDRSIYASNPLTYQDLLKTNAKTGALLDRNIKEAMSILKSKYAPYFKQMNKNSPVTNFSIFGCDIAPSNTGSVRVHECNKGPDLTYKDSRDGELKKNMTQDMLNMVCLGNTKNGFERIE